LERGTGRKKAVSTIIGGVIVFAIIFSTIATYFTFTEQVTNQRAILNQQAANEAFTVAGNLSASKLTARVTDTGASSISIAEIIVGNATTNIVLNAYQVSPNAGVNPGGNVNITCGGACYTYGAVVSEVWIRAISSLGTVNEVFYPITPQQVIAGTVGDLLLNFSSYSSYNVVNSGCTSGGSNSGYCFSGGAASASIITLSNIIIKPGSGDDTGCGDYDSDDPNGNCIAGPLAFSVQVTDLNPEEESIVLDQFTVLYQAPSALSAQENGNIPATFIPWYIVNVAGGQIQNKYSPIVLTYDVPTTIYFASTNCVAASSGPNPAKSACSTLAGSSSTSQIQAPPTGIESNSPDLAMATYLLTSGWEVPGAINLGSLTYGNANYGQELPYLATLYISQPTVAIDPNSGPPLTVIGISSGIGYSPNTVYSYCLSSSSTTVSCIAGTSATFTSSNGGSIPGGLSITVPAATQYGTYYVIVYQGAIVDAFALFTVIVTLTINPTASSAPVSITMAGSGYGIGITYNFCLSTTSATATCATTAQTFKSTATGTIPTGTAVAVPSAFATAYGTYYVVVYPTAQNPIVFQTFTIPPPTLNISPSTYSHTTGGAVALSGSGLAANTAYTVCMSGPAVPPPTACNGATGGFTSTATGAIPAGTTFTAPTVGAAGTYYVTVYIGATVYVYAVFTYT